MWLGVLVERGEDDVPALAVGGGATTERDGETEVERRHIPVLAGAAAVHYHAVGLEQVVAILMLAMFLLHALEDGELADELQARGVDAIATRQVSRARNKQASMKQRSESKSRTRLPRQL